MSFYISIVWWLVMHEQSCVIAHSSHFICLILIFSSGFPLSLFSPSRILWFQSCTCNGLKPFFSVPLFSFSVFINFSLPCFSALSLSSFLKNFQWEAVWPNHRVSPQHDRSRPSSDWNILLISSAPTPSHKYSTTYTWSYQLGFLSGMIKNI